MKIISNFISVIVACCVMPNIIHADNETNAVFLKVLQASNNIPQIIQTMPEVEALWPQEPAVYAKSINQIAHVAGGATDASSRKHLLVDSFKGMMDKSCPTNETDAAAWINLKRDTILFYLNFDEISNDRTQWLAIAKFIGEIRSKRIPNYRNQGMQISGLATTPVEQLQLQKDLEANARNIATDRLQSELSQADTMLVFFLQGFSSRCPASNPTNADFIQQITDAAHLTKEEGKKLWH